MNITYLVEITPENKTGLYNAIDNRIVGYGNISIINIKYYDSWLLSKVKILVGKQCEKPLKTFKLGGISVIPLNVKNGLISKFLKFILRRRFSYSDVVKKAINKNSCLFQNTDVLVAHWGMAPCTVARKLSKEYSLPVVNVFHGSDINTKPYQFPDYKKELVSNILSASNNIFVSLKLRDTAQAIVSDRFNSSVVYNGAKIPDVLPITPKVDWSNLDNNLIISFVGNHLPVKGADYLPEIIKLISNEIPHAHFVIAGSGALTNKIKSLTPDNVTFTGMVDKLEALQIIRDSDVLLVPSRNEGFPLVIAEALSLETKVVATNVGGISEVLNSKYLVDRVQERDFPAVFANKVIDVLLCNEKQRSMIELNWDIIRNMELEAISLASKDGSAQ